MHVYIGGASNGKRSFVRETLKNQDFRWFEGALPDPGNDAVVIAGIEKWLENTTYSEAEVVSHVMEIARGREAIFILTDIGRGIVPIDAKQRELRDVCGRLYQKLTAEAEEVTRIWYGIAQIIKKGEKTNEDLHKNRR